MIEERSLKMKSKSTNSKKLATTTQKTKNGEIKEKTTSLESSHHHFHNHSLIGGQLPIQKLHRNRTAFTEEQLQALENGKIEIVF